MAKQPKTAITPTRGEDYPEWYQQVIRAADMAENSPVRGCMVIKPWGYALWENMQRVLDGMFKATGHRNAYFPLFIPLSFLEKEAEHVSGFAKECAVVTHHRLEAGPDGGLIPTAPLEEPLIVRPTSEMIIGSAYARWVQSYRDLPILVNQWANVVRWEMRTRMFLRTSEFLWQEGHTVHETRDEAVAHTEKMLGVYADFARNWMAVPVITGRKSEGERFPGAVDTLCIEAMMQDRKALQAGTSHFLGQNFSKASGIKFQSREGEERYAWTTSWGVSSRLVGALIMTHSDDDGLVLPPKLAPSQIAIVPIYRDDESKAQVMDYCESLADELRAQTYHGQAMGVELDARDIRGGDKVWEWVKKGVPIRLEVGPRDVEAGGVFMGRRDLGPKEKASMPRGEFVARAVEILDEIQASLLTRATDHRRAHTRVIESRDEFVEYFTPENKDKPEIHGGFALTHFNGDPKIEEELSRELNVTLRCIPLPTEHGSGEGDPLGGVFERGTCPFSGEASEQMVVWAKAY